MRAMLCRDDDAAGGLSDNAGVLRVIQLPLIGELRDELSANDNAIPIPEWRNVRVPFSARAIQSRISGVQIRRTGVRASFAPMRAGRAKSWR